MMCEHSDSVFMEACLVIFLGQIAASEIAELYAK